MGWMPTTRRTLMMALNFAIASLDAETPGPRAGRKGMPYLRLELDGLSQRSHCCCRQSLLHHTSKTWMQSTPRLGSLTPGPLGLLRPLVSYTRALGSLTPGPLGLLRLAP